MPTELLQTTLPIPVRRGKVRDVYDLGDKLLIVATDRISAFDCIMPNGIPGKGKILTALSLFWFARFAKDFPNHLLATNIDEYPKELAPYRDQLEGRSMLVRKARVIGIECVARGYLAGSGWAEYQKSGTVCGIKLPPGLRQCDKLPSPIFTPATKEDTGHDINISFAQAAERIGEDLATTLRDRTVALYTAAADYAATCGILIADTKFEFGVIEDGSVILIDEVLTPDSSRFWPANQYSPGQDQESFDKQYVRNYLQTLKWNKTPPAPALPPEVVRGTRERYLEAYRLLTGEQMEFAAPGRIGLKDRVFDLVAQRLEERQDSLRRFAQHCNGRSLGIEGWLKVECVAAIGPEIATVHAGGGGGRGQIGKQFCDLILKKGALEEMKVELKADCSGGPYPLSSGTLRKYAGCVLAILLAGSAPAIEQWVGKFRNVDPHVKHKKICCGASDLLEFYFVMLDLRSSDSTEPAP